VLKLIQAKTKTNDYSWKSTPSYAL